MEDNKPKPVELASHEIERVYQISGDDPDIGMNMVSTDFVIVMVNRANERLYSKSMVDLLGKKCYEEFERRSEVCPHCPGAAALSTGKPHVVETDGIRDDGSRFSIEIMAYPVLGPTGTPVGFIEIEREITDRKRVERLVQGVGNFQAAVAKADNIQRAIRQALDASMALESIDSGCAFLVDPSTGEQRLVAQRGFPEACIEKLNEELRIRPSRTASTPPLPIVVTRPAASETLKSYSVLPVFSDDRPAARLVLGSSTDEEPPPSTRAALSCMGFLLGSALDRIGAESSRRETAVRVKAVLSSLPVAVFCLDSGGRVTVWNTAAEHVFGYGASEVIGQELFFLSEPARDQINKLMRPGRAVGYAGGVEFRCETKGGLPLGIWAFSFPFHHVMGDASETIVIAEPRADAGDGSG